MLERLRSFFHVFDDRFEDFEKGKRAGILYRDFSSGLIVAMTAIPMAMGFAMASGLRPEQGIIAGAIACLVGRTFGGSKYQVYGPTAAFIPLIAAIMAKYDHGFLVFVSIVSGIVLLIMGLLGMGRIAKVVPNSIVVGFTAGIAVVIALANMGDAFGVTLYETLNLNLLNFSSLLGSINYYAVFLTAITFILCRYLMRISVFIPAPLIAIGLCTWLANGLFAGKGVTLVADRYGTIPHDFFQFTPPTVPDLTWAVAGDMVYFVIAIVFISGVESLLCSSMADRLANNKRTPFNPDKEFWGQGMVQIITPLINGFPCTGALARTATSIKAGAVTPLAGYFKGVLKLVLAYSIASYLEHVPLACIAGVLFWVATNMLKIGEIKVQIGLGPIHAFLVLYTAVMVPLTDFLTGVLSALILFGFAALAARLNPSISRWVWPNSSDEEIEPQLEVVPEQKVGG